MLLRSKFGKVYFLSILKADNTICVTPQVQGHNDAEKRYTAGIQKKHFF